MKTLNHKQIKQILIIKKRKNTLSKLTYTFAFTLIGCIGITLGILYEHTKQPNTNLPKWTIVQKMVEEGITAGCFWKEDVNTTNLPKL